MPVWPIFEFRFCGKMTAKLKIFEIVFPDSSTEHRDTFHGQIYWKSAVAKLPKRSSGLIHTEKNSRSAGHLPKVGRSCPKFPDRCHPLDVSTNTEFGPDRLRFAGLIPERLIFRPKKSIQYRLSAYNQQLDAHERHAELFINKNLAIANRSRVSCAHSTSRASMITPWPWNLG